MNPYASHLPVLRAIGSTMPIRRVLEFGGGEYSTPEFLDRNSFPVLERLVTVERDDVWRERLAAIKDVRLTLRKEWEDPHGYDLIFIDDGQNTAERVRTIEAVAKAKPPGLVVIHDAEIAEYQEAVKELGLELPIVGDTNTGLVWFSYPPPQDLLQAMIAHYISIALIGMLEGMK